MLRSFANILKVPELRQKLFYILAILAVFRFGAYLPLPGIDHTVFQAAIDAMQRESGPMGKLFNLVDMFSGGSLGHIGLFSLGVMPYISASIIFSLMTSVVPALEKLAKEGPSGYRKINRYTRMTAVVICLVQAAVMSWNIYYPPGGAAHHLVYQSVQFIEFFALATLGLAAGSMFLVWLGDQITEFGIGQGVSIIIMLGIVSRFPPAIANMFLSNTSEGGIQVFTGMAYVAFLLVIFLVVILGIVLITLAHRRIPLQVARHVRGPRSYGGIRQYIPIKVNHANVMPIIFAQALMIIPTTMLPLVLGNQVAYWFSSGSFLYAMIYIILIVFFCFFWNAISLNPKDMAENLKNSGQFIPGIRPGEKTREYLSGVITRVTTVGAFFITLIALIPMIITSIFNLDMGMASALFSGSGLLIVVGVALDMVQKVEAQLAQRHYQGFMGGDKL